MAYGIRVESSSGFMQIDQDFTNYVLVANGSTTVNGTFNNLDTVIVDYGSLVSTSDTLLFARPTTTGQQGFTGFASISGELAGTNRVRIRTPYTGTIQFQVYQRASALVVPSSGYGINVLRPDNTLAYSTEYKVPRIFSLAEVNAGGALDINHSYSAIPYALMGNGYLYEYRYDEEPFPSVWSYMATSWTSSTSLRIESLEEESFGGDTQDFLGNDEAARIFAFIQG